MRLGAPNSGHNKLEAMKGVAIAAVEVVGYGADATVQKVLGRVSRGGGGERGAAAGLLSTSTCTSNSPSRSMAIV